MCWRVLNSGFVLSTLYMIYFLHCISTSATQVHCKKNPRVRRKKKSLKTFTVLIFRASYSTMITKPSSAARVKANHTTSSHYHTIYADTLQSRTQFQKIQSGKRQIAHNFSPFAHAINPSLLVLESLSGIALIHLHILMTLDGRVHARLPGKYR